MLIKNVILIIFLVFVALPVLGNSKSLKTRYKTQRNGYLSPEQQSQQYSMGLFEYIVANGLGKLLELQKDPKFCNFPKERRRNCGPGYPCQGCCKFPKNPTNPTDDEQNDCQWFRSICVC
jgi:hypothetical protein